MLPISFPDHLIILGGGSAGWMTAAYLDRSFNQDGQKRLRITLVESPTMGRIGVGEATIPTLRSFCEFLGISESTLMQRTSATLKQGIAFHNWNGNGDRFFHPFEALETRTNLNIGPAYLSRKARGIARPFDEEVGIQSRLAFAGLSPKRMMDRDYQAFIAYAYHLDAEAFADLLRDVAVSRGVEHVSGTVTAVRQSDDGDVTGLALDDGREITGDFFVDCSGFAQILIGKTLGVPFHSYANSLLCDRAIAIRVPRDVDATVPPYTQATALDAGWMWQIGLQGRDGLGYVYSSAHISDDDAEAELRAAAAIDPSIPARRLSMRIGRPETIWSRNVVSIGLAGGFIEPLESTGIQMVERALEGLVRYFPLSGINPAARDMFNARLATAYDELRDFITAHYVLSKRRDTPFWRAATSPERMTPRLSRLLDLWRDRHPDISDLGGTPRLFATASWQSILYGLDQAGEAAMANALRWTPDPDRAIEEVDRAAVGAEQDMPTHDLWLQGLRTITVKGRGW